MNDLPNLHTSRSGGESVILLLEAEGRG